MLKGQSLVSTHQGNSSCDLTLVDVFYTWCETSYLDTSSKIARKEGRVHWMKYVDEQQKGIAKKPLELHYAQRFGIEIVKTIEACKKGKFFIGMT